MSLVYENMPSREKKLKQIAKVENMLSNRSHKPCLLYTSDAADE